MQLMFILTGLSVLLAFVYSLMRVAHDADEKAEQILKERVKNGKNSKIQ